MDVGIVTVELGDFQGGMPIILKSLALAEQVQDQQLRLSIYKKLFENYEHMTRLVGCKP